MEHEILIDGYNVIKNNPMFQFAERRSQADARVLLLAQLKNRYRHTSHRVTVVFDGNGPRETMMHEDHICVIFSKQGEKADSVIARLAAEHNRAGRDVMMYSNDGEVRQNVVKAGGNAGSTQQLTAHLNAAPRDVAIRSQYRQKKRLEYGIDPMHKREDEEEEGPYHPHHPRHHKKKKKSPRTRH